MDGLSAAASVIAVVQLTGSIISICYEYRRSVKNASKDLRTVTDELISLRDVLERLVDLAETDNGKGSARLTTLESLSKADGPLVKCQAELDALKATLEPRKKSEPVKGWRAVRDALIWPLKGAEVKKVLGNLERIKSTLSLALTMDQTALTRGLAHSFEQARLDDLREKVHRWLSAPDPSSNHRDACSKRQPETGMWFIEGECLAEWKNNPKSFLWLHGIPGCGKTVLCSTIIEDIAQHCESDASLAVVYFYFDFNNKEKQSHQNLIRSLIIQFSTRCTSLPEPLAFLYSCHQNGQQQPTTDTLTNTLKDILGGFQHAYIILDALDECTEQDELLCLIDDIIDWKLDQLHILATSRKEREIEECLRNRVSGQVDIQGVNVDADIHTHIRERLGNDCKLRKWPPDVRLEIETTLMEGAHGMFRWVACQLDALRTCIKPTQLHKALGTLPKTLDETYDRILLNIDDDYYDDVFKILQWLHQEKGIFSGASGSVWHVWCQTDQTNQTPDNASGISQVIFWCQTK